MNIALWKICLLVTAFSFATVIWVVIKKGMRSNALMVLAIVLISAMIGLGYQAHIWYNKDYGRPFLKTTKTTEQDLCLLEKTTVQKPEPLPIQDESLIKEYLKNTPNNRPVIIGAPREVQIQFTDPLHPESPHAVFQIVFENKGKKWAKDIDVLWNIKDMGADGGRITPPNEWSKIIGKEPEIFPLGPNQGALQIYGPEIGAYAQTKPPQIQMTVTVHYKDENGNQYTYYFKGKTLPTVYPKKRYFFKIQEVK